MVQELRRRNQEQSDRHSGTRLETDMDKEEHNNDNEADVNECECERARVRVCVGFVGQHVVQVLRIRCVPGYA